ncbi:VOC family protein [Geodermatophilus sp. SYSU D01119]
MAGARTVPLLPCASIDEVAGFAAALGFETTYRQQRPNPCLATRRDDVDLHWFALPGHRPEDSYGSCLLVVEDPAELSGAFAAGLRERYGRLPLTGFPRITRPRPRCNAEGSTGFSVVDPGGNWIRVVRGGAEPESAVPASRLARSLADAVVAADSRGDVDQATKLLAGALRRSPDADPVERVEALAFLAELAVRREEPAAAREALRDLAAVPLDAAQREATADARRQAQELSAQCWAPTA